MAKDIVEEAVDGKIEGVKYDPVHFTLTVDNDVVDLAVLGVLQKKLHLQGWNPLSDDGLSWVEPMVA